MQCSKRYGRHVPVTTQRPQSSSFEPLPTSRHRPRQGMPIGNELQRIYAKRLVAGMTGLASHLHYWISKHSFGVVLVIHGKVE
jgi:hypothetical protein